jgi:hypothetical protein
MVFNRQGEAVGILRLHESQDRRTVLQVVGRRFELVDGGRCRPGDAAGRLVVIGLPGSLEDLRWPGTVTP